MPPYQQLTYRYKKSGETDPSPVPQFEVFALPSSHERAMQRPTLDSVDNYTKMVWTSYAHTSSWHVITHPEGIHHCFAFWLELEVAKFRTVERTKRWDAFFLCSHPSCTYTYYIICTHNHSVGKEHSTAPVWRAGTSAQQTHTCLSVANIHQNPFSLQIFQKKNEFQNKKELKREKD